MKNSLMIGAMALAAAAVTSAASAKTYAYGFYSPSGYAYCDGLNFTVTDGVAVGYHVYDQTTCVDPNGRVGGLEGTVPSLGAGKWYSLGVSQASGDSFSPEFTLIYYTNVKALTWVLSFESTGYGVPFQQLGSGVLVKGEPGAHVAPGAKTLGSTLKIGLTHIRK